MRRPRSSDALHVWFVTTGLGAGGAERALATLVPRLPAHGVCPRVVSLRGEGRFGPELRSKSVEVEDLRITGPGTAASACLRLAVAARRIAPDLLQGWMYHGNLVATAASALSGITSAWSVRQSLADFEDSPRTLKAVIRAGAILSGRPRGVLYNSHVAREQHRQLGYVGCKDAVVPNGFDLERFRPDPAARGRVRARLGLAAETPIVVTLARRHPVKGVDILLEAFRRLEGRDPSPILVLAGRGLEPGGLDLPGSVLAVGEIDRVEELLAAADVVVQASRGEGFPNAVGEAMACGVPVVATRAGDTEILVGDAGTLVAADDGPGLAAAIGAWLDLPFAERLRRGAEGRDRVAARFSADRSAAELASFLRAASGKPA